MSDMADLDRDKYEVELITENAVLYPQMFKFYRETILKHTASMNSTKRIKYATKIMLDLGMSTEKIAELLKTTHIADYDFLKNMKDDDYNV